MNKPKVKTYRTKNDWLVKGRRVKSNESSKAKICGAKLGMGALFEKSQTEKMIDEQIKEPL